MAATLGTHVNPRAFRKTRLVILWLAQVIAACLFFSAGILTLIGMPDIEGMFYAIGFGQNLRYITGSIQVIGAIMLLFPTKAAFGALLLTVTMFFAVCTHLFLIGGDFSTAFFLLIFVGIIAWVRRDAILSLVPGAVWKKSEEQK